MAPARQLIRHVLRRIGRAIPRPDSVRHRGYRLPPAALREHMCGHEFTSNDFFLESGRAEARRLVTKLGLEPQDKIVEIGSGLGRLAIGLLGQVGEVQYWGFDARRQWTAWCNKHVGKRHPSFRFIHVDVENELYNPTGTPLGNDFRFPLPDGHADIVYMWGVFTNMRLDHARIYASEISRLLRPGGRAFLTAFVEKNVPAESINPTAYVDYACLFPLHVVRYDQDVLFSMFQRAGLTIEEFSHHGGSHCNQSEIYLRKTGGPGDLIPL
jgi:SAM-dependent methyltransferase